MTAAPEAKPLPLACDCEWPAKCDGLGNVECVGCGGDLCTCPCGGHLECLGCVACEDEE